MQQIKWAMTDQVAQSSGIKCLIYAPSGVGKTMLAATAPRPIILSAESGLLSLRKKNIEKVFGANKPGIAYNIPVMQIETVKDIENAYQWLTEAKEASNFDTIMLDSGTEVAEQVLSNAKKLVNDPRRAYGEMADHFIQTCKDYRDIPNKNVVILTKMEQAKDDVSGVMMYGPAMPGKATGPQLPYLFDEVFRLGVMKDKDQKEVRFLQTQPDLQYTAKDRSGMLASYEPAHLGHIFNKIRGN